MSSPNKKLKFNDGEPKDFSDLPYEVLLKIFKYLDFKTVSYCATLCRTFNEISNDSVIYNKVTLKHNMDKRLLANCVAKITRPKHLILQYKYCDVEALDNYEEFDSSVSEFIKKTGDYLLSIHFESCRSERILNLLTTCPNLKDISFFRCRGHFRSLLQLKKVERLRFTSCFVTNKIVQEVLENNERIKKLFLADNSTINGNEVCETVSKFNVNIEELYLSEKLKVRAKGLKALARCNRLRVLELVGGPQHCDPEDALEHLAAGCIRLEKLSLYGWKNVNDDNLMPILHSCMKLVHLDLRGLAITVKSCREAALSLPSLKTLEVYKCSRIKKSEISKLQDSFPEINIIIN